MEPVCFMSHSRLLSIFSFEENQVVRVPVTLVAPCYVACHIETASSVELPVVRQMAFWSCARYALVVGAVRFSNVLVY
jgi:hypothetical protein